MIDMRIGMLSPLEMRVPPVAYGGTELIVSLLTEELIKKGHEVTLFASGDSITEGNLVSVCQNYLRGSDRNKNVLNMLNAVTCVEKSAEFDIIHNNTELEGMSIAGLTRTPMLTTLHGNLKGDWLLLFKRYAGWHNTISHSAKSLLPEKERFVGVIYNAIDVKSFPFNSVHSDRYLLFLSRLSHEKGPHLAIQVAKKLGMRLIIAGNVDTVDECYYRNEILPQLDGDLIKYVGEADFQTKCQLMSEAYALLAPITWPEPFGLFMIEAMACGTPVIVLNSGSAPEVVENNKTGFVVSNLIEMVEAVSRIPLIDRSYCRKYVEDRFDAPRMAEDYLRAYERILQESAVRI
jgi:glycosyltransferase involved in cell wall biosynthesis